jgi:polyhydroxyalkanoate synthesis regulator phasin
MPDLHIRVSKELLIRLKLLAEQSNMSLHDFVKMHLERLAHRDSHIKPSTSEQAHENKHINSSTSGLAHKVEHIRTSTSERGSDPPEGKRVSLDELVQRIADLLEKRLSRKIQDQLNPFTSKIDQMAQKQAELAERLESLEERVKRLEEVLQESVKASEKPRASEKSAKREKKSACEILKEQLVLFESDIAKRSGIMDRDRLFASIESKCGDIVIEGLKERIAVEKNFWSKFLDKLSKIDTSDDDKIKKQLDPLEFKLFKALKESALIVYSTTEKKWKLTNSITASTITSTSSAETSATTHTSKKSSAEKHYKKQSEEEDETWLLQYAPESEEI